MRISKNDDAKALIFWLTSEEAKQSEIRNIIAQKVAQYCTSPKYKVVTFISGDADYVENTKSLLVHNIDKMGKSRFN